MQRLSLRLACFTLLGPPKKLGIQSIKFLIGTGPSQMQRLSLRLASFTLLGPPKKLGIQSINFNWHWAFPNAAFKFKVGLFHFTWASQKNWGFRVLNC